MEALRPSLDGGVRDRRSLVLAQVLAPRVDQERLEPALAILEILVEVPFARRVAAADAAEFVHRGHELVDIPAADAVLERDEYRAIVRGRLDREDRLGPGLGRRQVLAFDACQRGAAARRQAEEEDSRRREQRCLQAHAVGHEPPEERARRQPALHRDLERRERPAANPVRSGQLGGRVER
ncbi:MAG TPA: hypothetical protein VH300_07265 [Thermoleophilaceae bacterium]|nr:hypothetical protein [Thermoleophilaceae bacterium]